MNMFTYTLIYIQVIFNAVIQEVRFGSGMELDPHHNHASNNTSNLIQLNLI